MVGIIQLIRPTFHIGTDFVPEPQSVIVPLLSEGDLSAEFHLHVVNLVDAPQHQIDFDVSWSVGGVHGSRSDPSVVDFFIENVI